MTPAPASDETLFAAALERPATERAAYLDTACAGNAARRARIEDLLRAHESAEPSFMATAASAAPHLAEPAAGQMIGRYKLLQKLGEGGCGTVYMAEQEEPVRRRVALKVIKLGMDTKEVIARFSAEQQALALMDHANIARVFDAGATESGRPFFVMELVRGVPITKFCDEQNLPTPARLELFTQVCHAVQHAHQKGIIHRDIKPSNILVTLHDGVAVPKVIDFGIAKATQGRLTDATLFTAFEQFIGTPAYMSPEQAEMSGLDIDTRSDIYSLGVLLYELLTGRPPFDPKTLVAAGLDEIRRIIREVEPPKPSTHLSTLADADRTTVAKLRGTDPAKHRIQISGDLDWIVMKALEKNRARRYETPSEFAADITRHLSNEPVLARPPSTAYRLGKMVRRNKLAFAAAGAITAALVIGLSVSTWMFFREKAARERAVVAERKSTEEAAISKAVSRFLTDDLLLQADSNMQASTGTAPNPDLKVREALDRASGKVGPRFKDQPLTEAAVRAAIGSAYQGVGDYAKSAVHYERLVELRKAAFGAEHRDTLEAMASLAWTYHVQGKRAEGAALCAQTLEIQNRVLGPEHPATLASMNNLANMYGAMGKRAESAALKEQSLEIHQRVLGPEHRNTLIAMTNLAANHLTNGKHAEAAALSAQASEIQKRVLGPEHSITLMSLTNLAAAYFNQGRHAEAAALADQTVEIQKRVLGPEHPDTLRSMTNLASFHAAQGKRVEAATLRGRILEIQQRVLGPEHPHTLMSMNNLAGTYLEQARYAAAAEFSARAWEGQKRVLGPEHRDTIESMRILVEVYRAQGRQAEIVTLAAQLLEFQQRVLGATHAATLTTTRILARAKEATGNLVAAEALLRTLASLAPAHDSARSMLGLVLVKQGKFTEAETLLRPIQVARDATQPDLWTTFVTRFSLGGALAGLGRNAEAEPLLVSGYEGLLQRRATIPSVDQERVTEAFEQLDHFYVKSDQPGKAAELRQGRDAHKHVEAGSAFERRGEFAKAIAEYVEATRLAPDLAAAWNGLAWTRATAPVAAVRDGAAAVIAARKACELTGWKNVGHLDTLAAAHAEAGEFDSAVEFQRKSLDLLATDHPQRKEWQERLVLYRERKPYRQPERTPPTAK